MRQWWLLLRHYSFLPIPERWQAPPAELPRTLALLPLWGLLAGLLCWGAARFVWVRGSYWAAALLLGLTLLLNGGVWLRDVMLLAEGRRPQAVPDTPIAVPLKDPPARPLVLGRAALAVGCVYLLVNYLCLLALLRLPQQPYIYVMAAVCCRWVYVWGVYDFAALRPAYLHLGLEKYGFTRACLTALPVLAVCVIFDPGLWLALLAALLAAWMLYRVRLRYLGALDEPVYGAAAAWAEILLFVVYVLL